MADFIKAYARSIEEFRAMEQDVPVVISPTRLRDVGPDNINSTSEKPLWEPGAPIDWPVSCW